MSQIDQINKTMGLLSQALNVAGSCLNQQPVAAAKGDIRRAIQKLESVKNDHTKKQNGGERYKLVLQMPQVVHILPIHKL